jgi:ATP-dependent DNA helicase DinG
MVQGKGGGKSRLLEEFKITPGAVLFATSSFWQGVDVKGEALSAVIIDKLPFQVPSDPLVAARSAHIEREGGNAFSEYQVPNAILRLKQGFGRLIRSTKDRGILAVLDNRISTKSYGRLFMASLPDYEVTDSIEHLMQFMN